MIDAEFGPQPSEQTVTAEQPMLTNASPLPPDFLQKLDELTNPENDVNFNELPPELKAMLEEAMLSKVNGEQPTQPVVKSEASQLADITKSIKGMNEVQSQPVNTVEANVEMPQIQGESGLSKFMKSISSFFKKLFSRRS